VNGRLARRQPDPAALDRLKLLGLLAMLADHLGKAWQPLAAWPWHLAGRPALLLFGLVIAHRLAEQPARAARYLPRLLLWGALAQPAYAALGNDGLDILFTYAAGCLVCLALAWPATGDPNSASVSIRAATRRRRPRAGALAAGLVIVLAGPWVEYGWAGVLLVPVGVLLLRHAPAAVVPGLTAVCLAANAPAPPGMLLQVAAVLVLAATGASAVLARGAPGPSRPLRGFDALYAVHLSLLAVVVHAAVPPNLG
jgi:TraX protein